MAGGSDDSQNPHTSETNSGNSNASSVKISAYAPLPSQFEAKDDWNVYVGRLDQYFLAYDIIKPERKVAILLTSLADEVFQTLLNLCFPDDPKTKTFKEICAKMKKHFSPIVAVYGERIKFYESKQSEGESITEFMTRLKSLSRYCKFGTYYSNVLRDKFVCGLSKGPILSKVCELEPTASFEDCVETALKKELAIKERTKEVFSIDRNKDDRKPGIFSRLGSKPSTVNRQQVKGDKSNCYVCGETNHRFSTCKYKTYKCKICKTVGHLAKMCKQGKVPNNYMEEDEEEADMYGLYSLSEGEESEEGDDEKYLIKVNINQKEFEFEVDTGSRISACSKKFYNEHLSRHKLQECNIKLKTYDGSRIEPVGRVLVHAKIKEKTCKLCLVVIDNGSNPLIGRDFLRTLDPKRKFEFLNQLDVSNISKPICSDVDIQQLVNDNISLFRKEIGCYKYGKVKFELKEGAKPVFCKPRRVPLVFQDEYQKQISNKTANGILRKIDYSDWGTPLVSAPKPKGGLRICGDYSITVNPHVRPVVYPLPLVEDLFATLNGGEHFSKLDLSDAYNQLELEEESQLLLTWSTTEGLFAPTRMPFGISPASAIFQSIICKTLQGCKGSCALLDDILVTGRNREEHINNLDAVFKRLFEAGFTLREDKCEFFKERVAYLGYVIDKNGLHKDPTKVEAIVKAPQPTNVTEIKSFVGLVGYYARFFPNIAQVLAPIYKLLQKDITFEWNDECSKAFDLVKQTIASDKVLVHYDQQLPVKLQCDASIYGVGAAIFHSMKDGSERPIAFASRTLSKAERNYSSLDREALAIYVGIRKFSHYLLGRSFTLQSDHEPLISIFGPKKGIPAMAAGRLQRWALYLANFTFDVQHIKGKHNVNADFLSRCPINQDNEDEEVSYLNFLDNGTDTLIDRAAIKKETGKDINITKIKEFVRFGWPKIDNSDNSLRPFSLKKEQLTIEDDILMWGYRIVMPTTLRKDLLANLHSTHQGIVKMKARARAYFWWPKIDQDIENISHNCHQCLVNAPDPAKVALSAWTSSTYPGQRIHADFLGPLRTRMFLIITDSYSKWPEVYHVSSTVATNTVEKFREYFARYGLADLVVTDNGPQFISHEFDTFCTRNGIKAMTTAAYKPQSNGAAENAVKSFKNGVEKAVSDPKNTRLSLETIINRYLFFYRSSVHSTTGETPHKLLFGRDMKTHFDRLKPIEMINDCIEQRIKKDLDGKKQNHKHFNEGDTVMAKVFHNNQSTWEQAKIIRRLGINMFLCKLNTGRVVKKHSDQIQDRKLDQQTMENKNRNSTMENNHPNNPQPTQTRQTRSGRKYGP